MEISEVAIRACDVGAAIAGAVLLSPILLITALAIKIESRGPVFVGEVHSEHDDHTTRLFKFRVSATDVQDNGMDQSITRVGRILGRTGIDELPQFINVLRGELSIFARRGVARWQGPAQWWDRQKD
jgi:lipopolysaccharide/colanic/teichoic acid biosynthesis glycosyltransferase